MSAQIINGKELSQQIRQGIKDKAAYLTKKFRQPCLAVILIGEDPASQVYVRNKVKSCEESGIKSLLYQLPAACSEKEAIELIHSLNQDESVDGILVQLPLPKHISEQKIIETIDVEKDVDGFHLHNIGALSCGLPCFKPCTPHGVIKMLESANVKLEGKLALVLGRSNIVGKPMAQLLLEKNATVILAHSKTRNLKELALQADIIVAAVGRPLFLKKEMVKPGAVVIDVGINRNSEGKLCGDVDFAKVKEVAGVLTPVPGGVGPMTITMLLENTLIAAEKHSQKKDN